MKNKSTSSYLAIFAVISLVFLVLATKAVAQEKIFHKAVSKPVQWYKPDEIIVKFKADTSEKAVDEINLKHGSRHISRNQRIGFRKLKVATGKNVFDLAAAYSKDSNVEYARPNYICRAFFPVPTQFSSPPRYYTVAGGHHG